MLSEISAFRNLSRATLVYVTHDQTEALGIADRVAVMEAGRLRQVASPSVLYRMPTDDVVSRFVGGGSVVPGEVVTVFDDGRVAVALFGQQWSARAAPGHVLGPAQVCIRPEDLRIVGDGGGFPATVARVMYQGGRTMMEAIPANAPETTLSLSLQSNEVPASGSSIRLALIDGWVIPRPSLGRERAYEDE